MFIPYREKSTIPMYCNVILCVCYQSICVIAFHAYNRSRFNFARQFSVEISYMEMCTRRILWVGYSHWSEVMPSNIWYREYSPDERVSLQLRKFILCFLTPPLTVNDFDAYFWLDSTLLATNAIIRRMPKRKCVSSIKKIINQQVLLSYCVCLDFFFITQPHSNENDISIIWTIYFSQCMSFIGFLGFKHVNTHFHFPNQRKHFLLSLEWNIYK